MGNADKGDDASLSDISSAESSIQTANAEAGNSYKNDSSMAKISTETDNRQPNALSFSSDVADSSQSLFMSKIHTRTDSRRPNASSLGFPSDISRSRRTSILNISEIAKNSNNDALTPAAHKILHPPQHGPNYISGISKIDTASNAYFAAKGKNEPSMQEAQNADGTQSNSATSSDFHAHQALSSIMNPEVGIQYILWEDVQRATDYFNSENILGQGGFGVVFKAIFEGDERAVKVVEHQVDELLNQNLYRHDNLLPLYAYSTYREKLCLICPLMSNGSLLDRLHLKGGTRPLSSKQRIEIATGTAAGLKYLHGQITPLIHGDIKSANILLDRYFVPKIGDFGLARRGPQKKQERPCGTKPYLPAEFFREKKLTTKVDTYSFGVVLYELATGLKAYDSDTGTNLKDRVHSSRNNIEQLIDPLAAQGAYFLLQLIALGGKCTDQDTQKRPTMDVVFKELTIITNHVDDSKNDILTKDDFDNLKNKLGPQTYDCFILYVDEDKSCAERIRDELEKDEELKLCDKNRDLIAGHAFDEKSIVTELISDRCSNKVLVILSQNSVKSENHDDYLALAHDTGCKVIPVFSDAQKLPHHHRYRDNFGLDYDHHQNHPFFWQRLREEIQPRGNNSANHQYVDHLENANIASIPMRKKNHSKLRSASQKAVRSFRNTLHKFNIFRAFDGIRVMSAM